MRLTNYLPQPSLLTSAVVPLILLARPIAAQGNNNPPAGGNNNPPPAGNNNPPAGNNNNDNNNNNNDNNNDNNKQQSSTTKGGKPSSSAAPSSTQPPPPPSSSTTNPPSSNTDDNTSSTTTNAPSSSQTTSGVTIGNDSGQTSFALPTNLPTLSHATIPVATVPPTANAPFMQQSKLPDGTVFIAVGAVLGAFAIAILLWRAIISLLLHRSVKRAAMAQQDYTSKSGFSAPPAPFYKYSDHASTMSLGAGGAAAGRGVRRTNRGPIPSSNPSQSNLFFSPTAAGSTAAGNRGSAFLPSGFYAAGTQSPGAGGHGHSISLTNLRPDSRGRAQGGGATRTPLGPSPPGTPKFSPRRDMSTSSLNLNVPAGQRAPSAYLDDLLADDPTAFPPPRPSSGLPRTASYDSGSQRSRF